jgi:hypothetical protein
MQIGVRIEESWSMFRPYRWLAERSVERNRRKLIHRESFRASVLHHSEIQAVLESIAVKTCLLTTPSFLSRGTQDLKHGHPPFILRLRVYCASHDGRSDTAEPSEFSLSDHIGNSS